MTCDKAGGAYGKMWHYDSKEVRGSKIFLKRVTSFMYSPKKMTNYTETENSIIIYINNSLKNNPKD